MEEFIRQNDELTETKQHVYRLQRENESMKKTIETILRVKCKRGEGAFSLNIDLKHCVSNNLEYVFSKARYDTTRKVTDVATDLIVSVMVGRDRNDIPCAVLDANTIVHCGPTTNWIASNFIDFAHLMHEMFKEHLLGLTHEHLLDSDAYVSVINTLLQEHLFSQCLKRALKVYKDM